MQETFHFLLWEMEIVLLLFLFMNETLDLVCLLNFGGVEFLFGA